MPEGTVVNKTLKKISQLWVKTKPAPPMEMSEVPDGSYLCRPKVMKVNVSKAGGRLQVSEQWKIVAGELKGQMIFQHCGLTVVGKDGTVDVTATKQAISFYKQRLEALMKTDLPDDPEELQDALDTFLKDNDDVWKIGLKTNITAKGKFQNAFINGIAEDTSEVDDDPADTLEDPDTLEDTEPDSDVIQDPDEGETYTKKDRSKAKNNKKR